MEKGKIIQVSGPVIDVLFEKGNLPHIKDALKVDNHGKECVMEVAKHMGHNVVRCIMLSASEGLCRDMEVVQTGQGITVPVGEKIPWPSLHSSRPDRRRRGRDYRFRKMVYPSGSAFI